MVASTAIALRDAIVMAWTNVTYDPSELGAGGVQTGLSRLSPYPDHVHLPHGPALHCGPLSSPPNRLFPGHGVVHHDRALNVSNTT